MSGSVRGKSGVMNASTRNAPSSSGGARARRTKEDAERQLREEKEREERELFVQRERDAEERQRLENELRDKLEIKERKRIKKEQQAAHEAEREALIVSLQKRIDELNNTFAQNRTETHDEHQKLLHMKGSLEDEVSQLQAELQDARRSSSAEIARLSAALETMERTASAVQRAKEESESELTKQRDELTKLLTKTTAELQLLRESKQTIENTLTARVNSLERELEKSIQMGATLQNTLDSREQEEKKSMVLLQLLNSQLDEQKRQYESTLALEIARNKDLSAQVTALQRRIDNHEADTRKAIENAEAARKKAEAEAADARSKLDHIRFDTKFLHAELHTYKAKLSKKDEEHESRSKSEATLREEVAALQQKLETAEQEKRKMERDHFDRTTFLNAQLSNNRTVIASLQSRLTQEKETHTHELTRLNGELARQTENVGRINTDSERTRLLRSEQEAKLINDVTSFKTATFQLQAQLLDKEREIEALRAEKDEEILRLRRKLDEAFVMHRPEMWETAGSTSPSKSALDATRSRSPEKVLGDRIMFLSGEVDRLQRESTTNESHLRAQIANLNDIIESLQSDIRRKDEESFTQIRALTEDNNRLRQTLDVGGNTNISTSGISPRR